MSHKNTKTIKIITAVILLGLLIFLGNIAILNKSRSLFFVATSIIRTPIFSLASGTSSKLASIFRKSALMQEVEALRNENQNLSAKLASFYLMEDENKILRQSLKIKQEKNKEVVIAGITGFQRQYRDDFLTINAGSEEGISAGDLAITENNIFIGRVKEVWNKNSRLVLSSSASENYPALLLPQNLQVLARGNNNQEILLDLVPENIEVKTGNLAVTSGRGEIFLEGLSLGSVISSRKLDNQIFQSVTIKTNYDPLFLRKIIIIKRPFAK